MAIEDVNLFGTVVHPLSVIISLSTDLQFAGCVVAVAQPLLGLGISLFRYRSGAWQWDASNGAGEIWMAAEDWPGGFSASMTSPEKSDEDFAVVEVTVSGSWEGPDVAFNWPSLTTELEDAAQRIMRGLQASYIAGSQLLCMDVAELIGGQISPPVWNSLERVVAEMTDDIESHSISLDGTTLIVSFILYSGAEGSLNVELSNELQ